MATTGALTNYGENQTLSWVLGASGTKYLALFTTAVAEDGTGTEVANPNWYARKAVTFTVTNDTAVNDANLDFGAVTDTAVTISHWALFDTLTGGNAWVYGDFTTPQTASPGNNVLVQSGSITVTAA